MSVAIDIALSLEIGGLPADTFRVADYSLVDAVSTRFRLEVRVLSPEGLLARADLVGKPAAFRGAMDGQELLRHGIVTEFLQYPTLAEEGGQEAFRYDLVIRPRLELLGYTERCRIFLNRSARDIVIEVLKGAGFAGDDFAFEAAGPFDSKDFTVQYNESDLNFIERLLEREGVAYFFRPGKGGEVLVIADAASSYQALPSGAGIPFRPPSGIDLSAGDACHISSIHRRNAMVTGKVTVKDYIADTPQVVVMGSAAKAGEGQHFAFGPHAVTPDDAARLAGIRSDAQAACRETVEGEGICPGFRSGFRFQLEDAQGIGFDGQFSLIRVDHRGSAQEGRDGFQAKHKFTTRFTAVPAGTAFRPTCAAVKPKIAGILLAKVDGVDGAYAYIDDQGRYHAKLPFDISDKTDGQASLPIRMAQPYAGPGYGMHFPLHNGNDLVLGFLDGDLDRPIALGALPNPSNPSPVTSQNKSESMVKTASGHMLRMDDKQGKTVVELKTSGEHRLALDDDPATRSISLSTAGEHLLDLDDSGKTITIRSKYGHVVILDDGARRITLRTKDGHGLTLDDANKSLTLGDGAGKTSIVMDGEGGNITMEASGNISLTAGGAISIDAGGEWASSSGKSTSINSKADFRLKADGEVAGKAGKTMGWEAHDSLRLASKDIGVEAGGDLNCKGKKITSKADDDHTVEGGKVGIKAKNDLVMKGNNVKQN